MTRLLGHRTVPTFSSTPNTYVWSRQPALCSIRNKLPSKLVDSSVAAPPATTPAIADDAAAPSDGAKLEKFLRAPFQKQLARQPGLIFPWRHSHEPLPRFVPGTPEFKEEGMLLGGNLDSSNPNLDAMATAKFFLGVPWYQILFHEAWKADLAENMAWAFSQGTAALLSNVYRSKCFPRLSIAHGLQGWC
jgi:hypothetical protein